MNRGSTGRQRPSLPIRRLEVRSLLVAAGRQERAYQRRQTGGGVVAVDRLESLTPQPARRTTHQWSAKAAAGEGVVWTAVISSLLSLLSRMRAFGSFVVVLKQPNNDLHFTYRSRPRINSPLSIIISHKQFAKSRPTAIGPKLSRRNQAQHDPGSLAYFDRITIDR